MIGYVMVGTNNLDKAIIFYDEVLKIINLVRKKKQDFSLQCIVTTPTEPEHNLN